MSDGAYLYIVKCRDGSLYIGSTRASLEFRISQHNSGIFGGYTQFRRPVELLFSERFDRITDAIAAERKLKGWSRAKKLALFVETSPCFRRWPGADLLPNMSTATPHPEERLEG
jgi:putative endonuclease